MNNWVENGRVDTSGNSCFEQSGLLLTKFVKKKAGAVNTPGYYLKR
jgi:hypothetical protein